MQFVLLVPLTKEYTHELTYFVADLAFTSDTTIFDTTIGLFILSKYLTGIQMSDC